MVLLLLVIFPLALLIWASGPKLKGTLCIVAGIQGCQRQKWGDAGESWGKQFGEQAAIRRKGQKLLYIFWSESLMQSKKSWLRRRGPLSKGRWTILGDQIEPYTSKPCLVVAKKQSGLCQDATFILYFLSIHFWGQTIGGVSKSPFYRALGGGRTDYQNQS